MGNWRVKKNSNLIKCNIELSHEKNKPKVNKSEINIMNENINNNNNNNYTILTNQEPLTCITNYNIEN